LEAGTPSRPASLEAVCLVEEVDEEVQFNHASPWKQRGIVAADVEPRDMTPGKPRTTRVPRKSHGTPDKNGDFHSDSPGKSHSAHKCRRV